MQKATVALAMFALSALGAGCSNISLPPLPVFPEDAAATDVGLTTGSTIVLEEAAVNPLENLGRGKARVITLDDWKVGDTVALTWTETYERETSQSVEARSAAERATGVGEEPNVPEPIYETIKLEGKLKTDALDDGQRILLPSEWAENEIDLSGSSSTVIWLSKAQYDELNSTRHTHLSLGMFDAGLQTAADAADTVKGFIAKFSGSDDSGSVIDQDITEIVASAEWGSYTLKWNDKKVRVPTIQAENQFASYTILANPENPIILEVELKAWAYGTEALGFLSEDLQIAGYSITAISTPSNHPEASAEGLETSDNVSGE